MSKNLNSVLTGTVFAFISSFTCAEVYQCQVDGKLVFQQTPCPLEIVETGCDENYDYLEKSYPVDAEFNDTYCFYLQLEKVTPEEKHRLMKLYKEKRAQAELLAQKEAAYEKMSEAAALQTEENYVQKSKDDSQ